VYRIARPGRFLWHWYRDDITPYTTSNFDKAALKARFLNAHLHRKPKWEQVFWNRFKGGVDTL
jgi:hypothetical protein